MISYVTVKSGASEGKRFRFIPNGTELCSDFLKKKFR